MVVASGTNSWAKVMAIRRRMANIRSIRTIPSINLNGRHEGIVDHLIFGLDLSGYNKREEDFPSLKECTDYLEEVEDMTYNLIEGIDVAAIEAKIAKFQEENWSMCRWWCYDFVQAEELAAALKASQNFGQGDPTDGVSCAPKLRGSYILFPPYALFSTKVLDQVLKGSMSAIKGSMHLPPCSVVCLFNHVLQVWLHSLSPSEPQLILCQGYATDDEETTKLRAERGGRAGGWTTESTKRRALEEAFSSIWM
ncbi:hypothetical protein C4D60_Mb02t23100 [Musa balbisiana]|uniref:MAT1 centre domain-containing protein n=1 Tax=Musa balbisiana TaxID=52838 RepID=A0A4S8ICS7_MUSBA|nr:hypothetical protein C4D60_Mb02t23100 [Musa balbisiana]